MTDTRWHGASFRDPSGRVICRGDELYRTVAASYSRDYDRFMESGLYGLLAERGLLIPHEEVGGEIAGDIPGTYRVLRPQMIPFVSYPWEWGFSQLRDAALLTLELARLALDHDMVLKDASAFNVQFVGCHPIFIDTLSFERYEEGTPWEAYRQFCEHFLAPLLLHSHVDPSMTRLLRSSLDGVPLDLARRLLPTKTVFSPSALIHVHAHGRAQRNLGESRSRAKAVSVSKRSLYAILDSLRTAVERCTWEPRGTVWAGYYDDTNYSDEAMTCKMHIVSSILARVEPNVVWDLGANTGRFAVVASSAGSYTVALDIDPAAVDMAYRDGRRRDDRRLLPLVMDLMNPTPSLGWYLEERQSLLDRGLPDLVLALALVHHLAIGHNVPLENIACFFSDIAPRLVIEFVPKSDSQVQKMLLGRRDIFPGYDRDGFEAAFGSRFETESSERISGTDRVIYAMKRR